MGRGVLAPVPGSRGSCRQGSRACLARSLQLSFPLTGMALSVLVVLLLAVLYESIKVGKAKLLHQALVSMALPTSLQLAEETDENSSGSDLPPVSRNRVR